MTYNYVRNSEPVNGNSTLSWLQLLVTGDYVILVTDTDSAAGQVGIMASQREEPEARREEFSFVHSDRFYVRQYKRPGSTQHTVSQNRRVFNTRSSNRGDSREGSAVSPHELPLQRYYFSSGQWSGVSPASVEEEPEEQSYWRDLAEHHGGTCCTVLGDCAYTFGGFWKYGYAVHELNLESMIWRRLEPRDKEDGPMDKENAGMVACGDEALCIFGGHGPDTGRHQPGAAYRTNSVHEHSDHCVTNELHLFNTSTCKSISHCS